MHCAVRKRSHRRSFRETHAASDSPRRRTNAHRRGHCPFSLLGCRGHDRRRLRNHRGDNHGPRLRDHRFGLWRAVPQRTTRPYHLRSALGLLSRRCCLFPHRYAPARHQLRALRSFARGLWMDSLRAAARLVTQAPTNRAPHRVRSEVLRLAHRLVRLPGGHCRRHGARSVPFLEQSEHPFTLAMAASRCWSHHHAHCLRRRPFGL